MISGVLRETPFERDWRLSTNCGPFDTVRLETYNATYGCNFRPTALRFVSTKEPDKEFAEPTPAWIEDALAVMVRAEGAGRQHGLYQAAQTETVAVSDEIVYDLLARYEEQIAFGERTESILEDPKLPRPGDKIGAILSDPAIGHKKNRDELTIAEVARGLDSARASGGPLVFLLPAFPFKDQNPFRSDLPASSPDFGEIAMLIHLHCLAMAINQVFRHDVVWVIVSDGSVYEEMFDVPRGSAYQYLSALRDWRSRLNLGASIHFIDLQDLVARHDAAFATNPRRSFSKVNQEIAAILRSVARKRDVSQSTIMTNLNELAQGMLWNRGWSQAAQQYGLDTLWQVHCASCDTKLLASKFHRAAHDLWSQSLETAIQYAAFNLASKNTRLLSRFLPSAIRSTSHVKPGQVGIPRETGVAPWNGLAVYERRSATSVRVRSVPLCQVPKTADIRFQLCSGSNGFGFAAREDVECYT
ncbi:MAG: L-tyrosine/L-tryptophan isonitrile synthase family protein [Deltaproteobacteria bacterium]|nr:L-tyrosine/L-tryptophan isonitrile synthase family protein [Deltaproteobacteria bacterium]